MPTATRTRQFVSTSFGKIAYVDEGEGPVALFVHGVFLNAHLWRHCVELLAGPQRRCVAVDLLAHGYTETAPDQEVSFSTQADMLAAFVDALGVEQVDLVGNDSGGGICQIFAARHPERLRTLTLTNCDVHDNWPPEPFAPVVELARQGVLVDVAGAMQNDLELARSEAGLGGGFEDPSRLSAETVAAYIDPVFEAPGKAAQLQAFVASMDNAVTVEIEPRLRALDVPTLILWGTADGFFDVTWARWLEETIPGARPVVEIPGAKLFFPEERYDLLSDQVRAHWSLVRSEADRSA